MLTSQRKKLLLAALKRDGQLVAKALSAQFGVSEDTIRRDLRDLAQAGLLQRVHGGALPASPAVADFSERRSIEANAKAAIARAACDGCGVATDMTSTRSSRSRSATSEYAVTP